MKTNAPALSSIRNPKSAMAAVPRSNVNHPMKETLCKRLNCLVILLMVLAYSLANLPTGIAAQARAQRGARVTAPFDNDWRFLKADAHGAEKPEFDDGAWRTVD